MNLKTYIEDRHRELDLSLEGLYDLFGSKTRYTRVMAGSSAVTLDDVIGLAERMDVSPLELIEQHGMGEPRRASLTHLIRISRLTGLHPCDLYVKHQLGFWMVTQDDLLHLRTNYVVESPPERQEKQSTHVSQNTTYEAA